MNAELIKTIEFEHINPERLIQMKHPDFTFATFFSGSNKTVSEEEPASIVEDLKIYAIFLFVLLVLIALAILLYTIKSCRRFIKFKSLNMMNAFFFSGMILSINITFMKYWVSINHQIKYAIKKDLPVRATVWVMVAVLVTYMIGCSVVLYYRNTKMRVFAIKNFKPTYRGIDTKHNGYTHVIYYPIFLSRRVIYSMIPILLWR